MFDGLESLAEEVVVEFLEVGEGKGLGEVVAAVEGFDLELDGHLGREGMLDLFDCTLELAEDYPE